ncbi:MAG: ribosomal-processing cysteine protease Prp [Lachnospiraceae bacterium]|nr:ribosomal-processing cysteine protease Prp [Lachnospiraceae bacterium]
MIKVTIVTDSDGEYKGFQITGHADYEEYGKDIICAAVSCLALNTMNSIEALTDDGTYGVTEDGLLKFRFTGGCSEQAELLMDSFVLGLTGIQEKYGSDYMKFRFKEV